MLIHEILAFSASRLPDKPYLIEDGRVLSFADTLAGARAVAASLQKGGVGSGDRVALLFANSIDFVLCYYGVLMLGAVVVPMNNRLAPKELAYVLSDSGPKALIVQEQFWEAAQAMGEIAPLPDRVILAGGQPREGVEHLDGILAGGGAPAGKPDLGPMSPASIMYTSGTTGLPKGAILSHGNVAANARNCGAHLQYKQGDTTLIVVPLFHVTGLHSQLVAFAYVGGTCVIMRAYNTAAMIELMARHRVTVTFKVPTMYTLMLVNQALPANDLSALRLACYGGAPMAPETITQLQDRLGVDLINAYGLTEATSLVTALPPCDALRKAGSIGLPTTGNRVKVVDDQDQELPAGAVGELLIKGPMVVQGYWNKPEATEAALKEGWLHTGDFARIDPEGFVYIADRKKDMIIRGGENVYSIEVESALVTHPGVLEAAVVPRAHSIFGEVVHAFVVCAPGAAPSEDEIITHCAGVIADYKVPASVSLVAELPRNPGGKVLKNALKEQVPPGDPPRR
ncbi:MAG: long-chain-fatty-acid--CoA ligase [Desulfarculaceae bacterium]|nr:long-chain-fatty-acid--CoA ligase [Desulfarculaceae bacterium]MCF8074061.1 long-chain-fatty-acid--CoA ligase [Desulfarculaceae bacterium]MCF8102101.1 long-chain-fatty-acid--CoA ligase [Desulfarculaceae bacterium]MCF8117639.1 long-chain-fatty-acid--CoA ligase [Desulfarculaceae bacterium]